MSEIFGELLVHGVGDLYENGVQYGGKVLHEQGVVRIVCFEQPDHVHFPTVKFN